MKRWLIVMLVSLLISNSSAQNTATIGVLPDNGPSLPATCVIGQIYFRTATTIGLNQCNPANTWTALATGAGSGTVNSGTTGQYAFYPASAASVSGGGPITTNVFPKGDATNAFANSLATDNATTLTYTGTGGVIASAGPLTTGATGVGGTVTIFGSASGSNTLTAAGNGTALNLSAATVQFAGAGTLTAVANTLTLTGGTVTAKAAAGSTTSYAGIDLLPSASFTATTTTQIHLQSRGTFAPTSGSAAFTGIISNPTINQTGGANGTVRVLASYPVNTALVGTEYLLALGTSSATGPTGTLTDKFLVDSNGATTASSTITAPTYATTTNCAAVGTAANPSVASCSAAPAGSFSCATNASTGTCVVNTTAVTANSEIFVTQRSDTTTGTRLGVTCNTGLTSAVPEITAVTAATSFTINLGTIVTNPECFSYFIVN